MLISHRKKFIYTKTVKTAGTSIESYFEKYCMPENEWRFQHQRDQYVGKSGIIGSRGANARNSDWFNHMSAAEIKKKAGEECWNNYFKFCVIRNPFDKLVSMFYFRLKKGTLGTEYDGNPIDSFRQWLSKGIPVPDRQQYVYEGALCMDYFIRFENLANDIKQVCQHLGLLYEPESLPMLKSETRDKSIKMHDLYSEKIKQMVFEAYAFEMEQFGYRFPG